MKFLQTKDHAREQAEPTVVPLRRGPTTRDLRDGPDPRVFVQRTATEDDWREFAAILKDRRGATGQTARGWRCARCGFRGMFPATMELSNCPRCNLANAVDGGRMVLMTDQERDQFLKVQADGKAAAVGRMNRAAWHGENADRAKRGLPPVSFDAFVKDRNDSYRDQIRRAEELGRAMAENARKMRNACLTK